MNNQEHVACLALLRGAWPLFYLLLGFRLDVVFLDAGCFLALGQEAPKLV